MPATLCPENEDQLVESIRWALAHDRKLAVEGHGSKRQYGMPMHTDCRLSTARLSGISSYEPAELTMTARAGTPLVTVTAALSEHGQCLPFEPPSLSRLYGTPANRATIAGVFIGNLSGPRRFKTGAARDYLLGVRAVNGHGELFKTGGAVIKNVTGYDLSKLLAGSWGTLAVASELTFKVMPAAPVSRSLAVQGLCTARALPLIRDLARAPWETDGLAYLPQTLRATAHWPDFLPGEGSLTVVRMAGSDVSVRERCAALFRRLAQEHSVIEIDDVLSARLWAGIRDVTPLCGDEHPAVLVKVSLPPARGDELYRLLAEMEISAWYADAGGAWFWIGLPIAGSRQQIGQLRSRLAPPAAGVVIYRADADIKQAAGILSPQSPAMAKLTQRLKASFDPQGILNPRRLYAADADSF